MRIALLLAVDYSRVSGASPEALFLGVERQEAQTRSLLLDPSLSERQRQVLARAGRTLEGVALTGYAAPHLVRVATFVSEEAVREHFEGVRGRLIEVGAEVVRLLHSRDAAAASAVAARLTEAREALTPSWEQTRTALTPHAGARNLCVAATMALEIIWDVLERLIGDYAIDLSPGARARAEEILTPLRRAA